MGEGVAYVAYKFPGQPKRVFDALTCPKKKYILFTAEEGAEEHCQSGAPALSINVYLTGWMRLFKKVLLYR